MPYKDPEKAKAAKKRWEEKNRARGSRHKHWMMIFYEEDSPHWHEELEELGLPCLVSPRHDRDVWTARDEAKNPKCKAGHPKKAHRHVLVEYDNPVDYETVQQDFGFLAAEGKKLTKIKYAKSQAAMARYLIHRGAEDKAQYKADEVGEYGGADFLDWSSRVEDIHATMKAMRAYIREYNITEFTEFIDYCDNCNEEWARLLDTKCSWAIGFYIDRLRNAAQAKAAQAAAEAAACTYSEVATNFPGAVLEEVE